MADTVKHTPGPWKAVKATHGPIDIIDPRGRDVVTVYGGGVETESQSANANLIAAAPDLLGALKDIETAALQGFLTRNYCADIVIAAIAKAEGRS